MWITTILLGVLIALIAKYVSNRRKRQSAFKDQGIPGVTPHFVWGNLLEYKGSASKLLEWRKQFGRTFYMYDGDRPNLVTSDLEIIKQVGIKDFSNFHSRELSIFFTPDDSLVHVKGKVWKRLRMIVSPTFSARRMKEMSPLVNSCVDGLLENLITREEAGKPFNIMTDFQGLTMTAIATCGFGLDIDASKDPNNIFLKKCQAVFNISQTSRPFYWPLILAAGMLFPIAAPLIRRMMPSSMYQDLTVWFYATAAAIIESRKNSKERRNDFIQLMLDAEDQGTTEDMAKLEVTVNDDEAEQAAEKPEENRPIRSHKNTMSIKEIQAQCMAFLLAGYETTSTALSFTAYELALHPEIQFKLQEEIDEHFPDDDKLPDYLSVQKLPYLDMVFNEILRLHSIAEVVTMRKAVEEWNINGLFIPKGSIVRFHMEAVHKDPEYWGPEDPEDFVPDRFLPERKSSRNSLAWQPFGVGPRNCVGMRFALMEAKITLARLLKMFTICRTEETVVPIKVAETGIRRPVDGVIVRLERRS